MDIRLIFACLLLVGPCSHAAGEVYRWTDANGQVHYGDVAPTDRTALPIDTRDALDVHGAGPARPDAGATSATPTAPAPEPVQDGTRRKPVREPSGDDDAALAEARRRCEAQRRVDCDTLPYADTDADRYPVWLPHRRIVRPAFPSQRPRPPQGNEASAAPTHLMRGPAPRPNALR